MKDGGICKVVEKLEEKLKELNVKIYTNSTINNIKVENKQIKSVQIDGKEIETNLLISSVGLYTLANLLNIDTSKL